MSERGRRDVQLLEPVPVEDELCTRLALIEDLGFGARFVLAHNETVYETGQRICVVKRKIVLPYAEIRPGIDLALRFLARHAAAAAGRRVLRAVS
jgi:hypothetical protein